jgi:diaminopimelate epimerase
VRIFAKFLYEHGYTKKETFTLQTKGGIVRATVEIDRGRVRMITVDMGQATFRSREIPVAGADREVIQEELEIQGKRLRFTGVSVGNPHCVILTDHLDPFDVKRFGPAIECHPLFPQRINVQFAQVIARDRVKILIWERGAGYTLASGSSSCAVAAACRKNRLVNERVTIEMPGGELAIEVGKDWNLKMRGPAEEVCTGTISPELLQAIASGFEPPAELSGEG